MTVSASFASLERVLENQRAVQRYTGSSTFWDAIGVLQYPELLGAAWREGCDELTWLNSEHDSVAPVVANIMGDVAVSAIAAVPADDRGALQCAFAAALTFFEDSLPSVFDAFKALTCAVICARREGYSGGTVSTRIGAIWINPTREWTTQTWVENLLHEFIHNALFLEDMVNGVLLAGGDRLEQEDALALSAIRQIRRGYDKAYHSAHVAHALVEYYLAIGKHGRAMELLAPLMPCLDELRTRTQFLSPHGAVLLKELTRRALQSWRDLTLLPESVRGGAANQSLAS